MRFVLCIFFSLIVFIASQQAGSRGFAIRSLFEDAVRRLIPSALTRIQNTPIPELEGETDVPVIGLVDFKVSNMKVSSIAVKQFDLVTAPPSHISGKLIDCTIQISLKWNFKQRNFPRIGGDGTASASTEKANILVGFNSVLRNNKPYFTVDRAGIDLGNLNVKVNGGFAGWVVNLMTTLFKSQVKKSIEKAITETLTDLVNKDLNEIIQAAAFIVPLYQNVSIDLHLQRLNFNERFVLGSLNTLFVPSEYSSQKVILPENPPYDRMLQAFFHQIVFTSFGRAFFKSGILKATVNSEDVPPESPLKLDTKSLQSYIPELYAKWPDKKLQVVVDVTSAPNLLVNTTGLYLDITSNFLMNVMIDGVPTKAFLAKFGAKGHSFLKFADFNEGKSLNLTGEIKRGDMIFQLVESYMGEVDLQRMEKFLNIVVGRGMIASANRQLKQGYTLPFSLPEGLSVKDIIMEYFNDHLGVAANIYYKAPPQFLTASLAKEYEWNNHRIFEFVKLCSKIFVNDFQFTKEMEKDISNILTKLFQVPELLKDQ